MKREVLLMLFLLFVPLYSAFGQKGKAKKRDVNTVEKELVSARDSLKRSQDQCVQLLDQVEKLDTLRKLSARSMLGEFSHYPSLSFALVDDEVLDSLRYLGSRLSLPETDRLLAGLDTLEHHLSVYRTGWEVLDQDYDSVALDSVSVLISKIMGNCSEVQQVELEDILNRIRIYPTAIERAKIVAEWMANSLKDLRAESQGVDTAVGLARSIFKNQDPEYREYISKVPYMDRLYNDYMKAILETPLQAGPQENQLLSYDF